MAQVQFAKLELTLALLEVVTRDQVGLVVVDLAVEKGQGAELLETGAARMDEVEKTRGGDWVARQVKQP